MLQLLGFASIPRSLLNKQINVLPLAVSARANIRKYCAVYITLFHRSTPRCAGLLAFSC